MRILQVSHGFPPGQQAGVEIYVARLMRELQGRGHELAVFHGEKDISERDGELLCRDFEGMRCYTVINNLLYRSLGETYENRAVEERFRTVLEDLGPDAVHFHHLMQLSCRLPELARDASARVVMTLHDFWLQCPRFGQMLYRGTELCEGPEDEKCAFCVTGFKFGQSPAERIGIRLATFLREKFGLNAAPLLRWMRGARGGRNGSGTRVAPAEIRHRREALEQAAGAVDRFLVPSLVLRDHMADWGVPASKLELSRYGIDTGRFGPREERASRGLRVGFLGTLAEHKGVHVLVDAMRRLERADAELEIWGRASYYPDYVSRLKREVGNARIRFRGEAAFDDVPRILAGLDVLAVPSLWYENSPFTIQEAFASGVPVVASQLGGMAELVEDRVSGL
ncbi:MAG: glycosyltransferase, partial [Planctomycetota bacterium]